MNIILLEQEEIANQNVCLEGPRAKHIVKILRSEPGDSVRVGVINGSIGYGIIKNINNKQPYSVLLEVSLDDNQLPAPQIDILLALPRPIMFKRVLSQATALGVGVIYVINARRVEKSFWDSTIISQEQCREHLFRGLEQAVDTRLPTVSFHKGFKPFIQNELEHIRDTYKYLIVAHPGCLSPIREVINKGPGRVLIAVGPEGGWVDYEIESMRQAGFVGFSLGPRILKVDTAVIALHSMVSVLNY